jgi:para-aminobenzoate synthetase component 1
MASEPLVVELIPPPDPWEVADRFAETQGFIFFDSAGGPSDFTRYSYLSFSPFRFLRRRGPGPFYALGFELSQWKCEHISGLPPFQGGAAGLFGYELSQFLERLPERREFALENLIPTADEENEPGMPDLCVGLYDWVIAWDHQQNRSWIVSTGLPLSDEGERRRLAEERIELVRSLLRTPAAPHAPPSDRPGHPSGWCHVLPGNRRVRSNFSRDEYEDAARRAVEYTHAGDCFQVNLSQQLFSRLRTPPIDLYRRLRAVNPAPFAAYFNVVDFQIISASPERFLKMSHDGQIETRPIKGTRSRGYTPEHDAALHGDLLESDKDRAENVMIVDLLRNDLGRVCEYGSVKVESVCQVESYPTVHHLVSEVRGQLRKGLTAIDLLEAAFPGGSVTGAPKVRAMEIIAELEPHARGPYCGSLGWIGFDGAMDTNILIRTFTAAGGWLQFPVGGGIVADSDPQREYEETLHKAAGLLRALEPS